MIIAIFAQSSLVRRLNTMISSTRLMNSGRRKPSSARITLALSEVLPVALKPADELSVLPALVVMTIIAFSKLQTLPCESVILPSSSI